MAPGAERQRHAADGYRRMPSEGLVAVSAGTCVEGGGLFPRGKAAGRLPRLRRKGPAENKVIQPVETGRKYRRTDRNEKTIMGSIAYSMSHCDITADNGNGSGKRHTADQRILRR